MSVAAKVLRLVGVWLAYVLVAAVIAAPLAVEQAVETARFEDELGSFPVEVALAHNGVSTLDTGLVGELYWQRTGVGGFGASLRSTGPPVAGGSLASYVTPEFLQANATFIDAPDEIARVYGEELRTRVLETFVVYDLMAALLGGSVLLLVFRGAAPPVSRRPRPRSFRIAGRALYLVAATGVSVVLAVNLFARWDGSREIEQSYPMPGVDELSFSSSEALEVARQIQPFIEKNTRRIEERTAAFRLAAITSLDEQVALHEDGLAAREGEHVVIAEADPQGSRVATLVRADLYSLLQGALGEDTIVLRTIAGDVTSNGAVAEKGFVDSEAEASPGIPVIAVKGDHDSSETVDQLRAEQVTVPDLEVVDGGGLRVTGAADPDSKALFGGLVTNTSGVTQAELGQELRQVVDDEGGAVQVVLHQPRAAAAYLGIDSLPGLSTAEGRETTPYDDGIPDVAPGTVTVGHLHDASGPWVIWNTDGDEVTWTVVSQLGTAGGVEENPTFNRFSTPFSVPLKDVSVRLNYLNSETGLQTGYASVVIGTDGSATIQDRVDVGLPGGEPVPVADLPSSPAPGVLAAGL